MDEVSGDYRKKFKRLEVDGLHRFITFSCYRRQPFLNNDCSRTWFVESLLQAKDRYPFDLRGYVIMPEHIHLVILPREDAKTSQILSSLKKSVSQKALRYFKKNDSDYLEKMRVAKSGEVSYRFWQHGGGYDRILRTIEDVQEKVNYCHKNPVKRGLVSHPKDWYWSSFNACRGERNVPVRVDRIVLKFNQDVNDTSDLFMG